MTTPQSTYPKDVSEFKLSPNKSIDHVHHMSSSISTSTKRVCSSNSITLRRSFWFTFNSIVQTNLNHQIIPIAIKKGSRSTRNPYRIYNFVSIHRHSPFCFAFFLVLSFAQFARKLGVGGYSIKVGTNGFTKWSLKEPSVAKVYTMFYDMVMVILFLQ